MKLERVRAVDIANAIVQSLENLGLSLSNLRGQGYDGGSTMSGEKAGVQARIREKQQRLFTPIALAIHLILQYRTHAQLYPSQIVLIRLKVLPCGSRSLTKEKVS